MEDPAVIENAIRRFYSTGQSDVHQWLLQFQNSDEAWHYVWLLLNHTKPLEVQFFAANTLYAKISNQWLHLPQTKQEFIRNQLIGAVKQDNLHKVILGTLCQSVSALLGHLNSVPKETETCFIDDLVQIFPYNDPVTLQYLLQTLLNMPTEVQRKFGSEKLTLRHSLQSSWSKILWLLTQVFESCNGPVKDKDSNSLYELGLESLSVWLNMSQFPVDITEQIYPYLLQSCKRYLSEKQEDENCRGFDLAQDCLITIVTNQELNRLPTLLWKWAKALLSLVNNNKVKYYYQLLKAFGETHSRTLLLALIDESKEEQKCIAQQIIDYLLQCSDEKGRYPTDERYSVLPFGFWYNLQDDVESLDRPQNVKALQVLKPIYMRLTLILLRKSELPLTPEEAGDADEREMFRCYRQDISDTYAYCHNILESEFLLLLGQRLSAPPQSENHWTFIESSIFAFMSISECACTIETNYLEAILDIILTKINYENYPDEVLSSACSTIGSLSEWIGVHAEWVEKCLRLLGTGLTKSSITSLPASMALIDIVRESGPELPPFALPILDTVNLSIRVLNDSGNKGEGSRLMFTAGRLIGQIQDHNLQLHYLELILGHCILKLKQMIEETPPSELCIKNQFKMVGSFVNQLSSPIIKTVLQVVIPVFQQSLCNSVLMANPAIVESMLDCLQQFASAVSYVSNDGESDTIANILGEIYKQSPHPKAFTVMTILIKTCDRRINTILGGIFTEMCAVTLAAVNICASAGGSLSNFCDILQGLFTMLGQSCKRFSEFFVNKIPEQFGQMVQLATISLSLPEVGVVRAVSYFLSIVIAQNIYLNELGQQLVCAVVHCITEKSILNNLQPHADILHVLNKKNKQFLNQCLRNALYSPSGPQISNEEKDNFIRMIVKNNTKVQIFQIIKSFGLLCRQTKINLVHR